ncbi:hypothetical protein [Azomonas macrocytogenes]|uniref:Uncharacterized protein n=1 Tax=Azomonas macrocytogenes TaxID=69962 RepID=A0A839T419_AZOMA|nr:hypothetical protein [Azomonas macrocytogenes]MBB3103749.1 hypothetical protein [Azomonas macrocytogenes]
MLYPGKVLLDKKFVFSDGSTKEKYLVIIGKVDHTLIAVKTTSKGHRYRNDFGCQSGNYYPAFLLPAGSCCFPLNTWVCLGDFYELKANELQAKMVAGQVYRCGEIPRELIRDIQFCAKGCDDISGYQEGIIDQSLVSI